MKTIKTLKERNEIIYKVLLDSIYSDDITFKDDTEKLQYTFNRLKSEYGHEIKRSGVFKACSNWLSGLALDIPFYNSDILKLAEQQGYKTLTEKQQDKILSNYWNYMSNKFLQLCKKHKINIYEVV